MLPTMPSCLQRVLALEQLHRSLRGRAKVFGRLVGRHVAQLHEPLLNGKDLLALIALFILDKPASVPASAPA